MEEDVKIINEKQVEEPVVEGTESNEEVEESIQTTLNTDGLDISVAEGEIENVEVYNED